MLFDAVKDGQKIAPKWVAPEEEQEPNESRRCVRALECIPLTSCSWSLGCA